MMRVILDSVEAGHYYAGKEMYARSKEDTMDQLCHYLGLEYPLPDSGRQSKL